MPIESFREQKTRRLHFKRLGLLLIVLALSTVVVYRLHAFQQQRNARSLLIRAHNAEDEGQLADAAEQMRRYLRLSPDDNAAWGEFGILLSKVARQTGSITTRRLAFFTLERAVRNDRDRNDLRLELVRLALDPRLARYKDARDHLKVLLGVNSVDPELLRNKRTLDPELVQLLGLCFEAERDFAVAVTYYEIAIERDPTLVDCYARCARLYRRLNETDRADKKMNDEKEGLLARNKESAAAYLAHARYTREFGKPEDADKDLKEARSKAPTDADVLLVSAEQAIFEKKLDEAREYLNKGIEAHPKNAQMYLTLDRVDILAGKPNDAAADLKRGLEQLPQQPDLQWELIDVQVELGEFAEASDRIKRLRFQGYPRELLGFEEARILVRKNNRWLQAATRFEEVARAFEKSPVSEDLAKRTLLERASCYLRLGKLDRRLELFNNWLDTDPQWQQARLGQAETLVALGNLDGALAAYQRIVPQTPQVRLTEARLQVIQNLRQVAANRNWRSVKDALEQLRAEQPNSLEILLLSAEVLVAEDPADNCKRAEKLLRQVVEPDPVGFALDLGFTFVNVRVPMPPNFDPKLVGVRLALSAIAERQGDRDRALERLDESEKLLGDMVEIRLARARFLARSKDTEAHKRIGDLAADLNKFSADDQEMLLRGIGKALVSCGQFEAAQSVWQQLAGHQPDDLSVKLVLFDLARQNKDTEATARILKELQKLEGPNGSYWRYCEVSTLMRKALERDSTAQARTWHLLSELKKLRPSWGRIPALEGEIHDAEHKYDLALECFKLAFSQGERNPFTTNRLLRLLYAKGDLNEASRVISRLPEEIAVSSDIQRILAEIAFQNQQFTNAYDIARKVVPEDSTSYSDYLWLASMAQHASKDKEAEEAFEKAKEYGAEHPEVWVLWISYRAAAHRIEGKDGAREKFEEGKEKLARDPVALALCHELLGEDDKAREILLAAADAKPLNPYVVSSAAAYLVRRGTHDDLEKARDYFAAVTKDSDSRTKAPMVVLSAHRMIAQLSVLLESDSTRTARAFAELELLDAGLPADASPDERIKNMRTKSIVLGAQAELGKRTEAIKILETMRTEGALTLDDTFRLARLYDSVGDWTRSSNYLTPLLKERGISATYLLDMSHRFLRHREKAEAAACLEALEKLPKDRALSFAILSLRAALLNYDGKKSDEAVKLLADYAEDPKADLKAVALSIEGIDADKAEKYYDKYVDQSGKAESKLVLALYLGRRHRAKDALDLCEICWDECKPTAVAKTAVAIVMVSRADESQSERVATRLEAAIDRHNKDKPTADTLRAQLGNLRTIQGKYDQAIKAYRDAVDGPSADPETLNNLAWLLTLHDGSAEEALKLLDRAEQKTGPTANLLDNRALANLKLGTEKGIVKAIRDLEDVVAEAPKASYYLHLAEAYLATKKPEDKVKAKKALTTGEKEYGLGKGGLHPLEVPKYLDLKKALDLGPS